MQELTLDNGYLLQTPRHVTYDDVHSINYLLAYLSPGRPIQHHSSEKLNSKLTCGTGLTLFVAREPTHNSIVAMASLIRIDRLSKLCGRIEDVVVHTDHQCKGLARALIISAMHIARNQSMQQLDLTSGHVRVGAHALYESLGFGRRDTSVWRIHLDTK